FGNGLHAGLDGLADAATLLNGQHNGLVLGPAQLQQSLTLNQMDRLSGLTTQAHEDIGGDVGVLGEAGQRAVKLVVVRPVVLHRAAAFVCDRHDPIDVRIFLEQVGRVEPLRNVLAGAGGTVHRADDGDVVARAIAAIATVVAHPRARIGARRRRRTIAAESIIALEGLGTDVVDVNVLAGGNVFVGKANDLPIFGDSFAFFDEPQGKLV